MAISEAYSLDAVTIGVSETSIVGGSPGEDATDGVYQLWVDPSNMAKGDEFKIRIYERVKATGTKRIVYQATLSDAQSELFVTPSLVLMHGWDMSIQKIAGTDRAFDASVRKVA